MKPTSKIATARQPFWRQYAHTSPGCADGAYAGDKLETALIGGGTGPLKSLSDPTQRKALSSSHADGS